MKNYVSLERTKSVDKDALIDKTFEKFNKQNVDKNGNYVKYSELEQHFDGNTQMYEGLQQLEDGLIDYIEIIQTVKDIVKNKLRNGNFGVDKEVKDKLFNDIQDLQTYDPINSYLIILVISSVVSTNLSVILTRNIFINYKREDNMKKIQLPNVKLKKIKRVHELEKTVSLY